VTILRNILSPNPLAGIFCIAAAVSGCNGTEPGESDAVQYQFALAAVAGDTTPERIRLFSCQVFGYFMVDKPVAREGTVRFPLTIQRYMDERQGTHVESTMADSSITEAVLEYSGLGGDSLSFTLGIGSYTVTLGPGGTKPNYGPEYSGPWTCGPSFPLATDSTLLAYGFDPNFVLVGDWRVSETLPMPD
jgi:hypothetical protein